MVKTVPVNITEGKIIKAESMNMVFFNYGIIICRCRGIINGQHINYGTSWYGGSSIRNSIGDRQIIAVKIGRWHKCVCPITIINDFAIFRVNSYIAHCQRIIIRVTGIGQKILV